jgi:hypothetical protein
MFLPRTKEVQNSTHLFIDLQSSGLVVLTILSFQFLVITEVFEELSIKRRRGISFLHNKMQTGESIAF